MARQNQTRNNPLLAKMCPGVVAEVSLNDILHLRPDWSPLQATEFLNQNARAIGQVMLLTALQTVKQIMENSNEPQN